ncbi:MAG: hypothetical protein IKH88_11535 [Prevotella sp.]|nr:hypothetical protein [Prevotella sp.]
MQKTNFTQLGAFGTANEKTYRRHFEECGMDTLTFNLWMAKQYFKGSIGVKALTIDPSYISKSGRHALGLSYFWSGVAGKAKWGLEILGVGIIDTFWHDCFMLGGFQPPSILSFFVSPSHIFLLCAGCFSHFYMIKVWF